MRQSTSEDSKKITSLENKVIEKYLKKFFELQKQKQTKVLREYLMELSPMYQRQVLKALRKHFNVKNT